MNPSRQMHNTLIGLKPAFAKAAQAVYDNTPGPTDCGKVADAMGELLKPVASLMFRDSFLVGGHDYLVVGFQGCDKLFRVDVPWHVYKEVRGDKWVKLEHVTIEPDDVEIQMIDRKDVGPLADFDENMRIRGICVGL